jgi:hypothetical protein
MMGIGNYMGELRRGPDGELYQWNEEVDGLGNIHGWWSKIKKGVSRVASSVAKHIPGARRIRRLAKRFCGTLPKLQPILSRVPMVSPYYRIGTTVCKGLKKVGLAGEDGEIMEAPDGQHYEVIQGIGEIGEPVTMTRPVKVVFRAQVMPAGKKHRRSVRRPRRAFRRA